MGLREFRAMVRAAFRDASRYCLLFPGVHPGYFRGAPPVRELSGASPEGLAYLSARFQQPEAHLSVVVVSCQMSLDVRDGWFSSAVTRYWRKDGLRDISVANVGRARLRYWVIAGVAVLLFIRHSQEQDASASLGKALTRAQNQRSQAKDPVQSNASSTHTAFGGTYEALNPGQKRLMDEWYADYNKLTWRPCQSDGVQPIFAVDTHYV